MANSGNTSKPKPNAGKQNEGNVPLSHPREGTVADTRASVLAFCEQIKKDAQEEIEKILGRARLSATRKLEEAENEAESIARQIREAGEVEARRTEASAMSGVSLDTKKVILRAEGDIVDEVLAKVMARLKERRGSTEYAEFLRELTVQAIIGLDEEECLLAPGMEDRELYTAELLGEIQKLAQTKAGNKVKLTLSPDLSPEGAGVRVYSGDGTALFDNTLDARMERLQDELKAVVAGEVFASGPSGESGQTDAAKNLPTG